MIICICANISDHQLIKYVKQGYDLAAIQTKFGVSMQCGSCRECVHRVVEQQLLLNEEVE